MSKIIDITGKRFERLVVLKFSHFKRESYWKCLCDCGEKRIVAISSLNMGHTRSCGCLRKEIKNTKKGKFKNYNFTSSTLHHKMYKIVKRNKFCSLCLLNPSQELANLSQEYKLDPKDWIWLCKTCHRRYDNGWKFKNKKWFKICRYCMKSLEVCSDNFYRTKLGKWITTCKKCRNIEKTIYKK